MLERLNPFGASVHIDSPVHFLNDVGASLRKVRVPRRAVGLIAATDVYHTVEPDAVISQLTGAEERSPEDPGNWSTPPERSPSALWSKSARQPMRMPTKSRRQGAPLRAAPPSTNPVCSSQSPHAPATVTSPLRTPKPHYQL